MARPMPPTFRVLATTLALLAASCGSESWDLGQASADDPPSTGSRRPNPQRTAAGVPAAAEVQALADRLLPEVGAVIGLPPLRSVPARELDRRGMRAMLAEDLRRSAEADGFHAAAAQGAEADAYLDEMQDQVLGLYDPVTKRLVLIEGLGDAERERTMRHELTHALQDQHFALTELQRQAQNSVDRTLALTSVLEGQAMVAMEVQGVAPELPTPEAWDQEAPGTLLARLRPGHPFAAAQPSSGLHGAVAQLWLGATRDRPRGGLGAGAGRSASGLLYARAPGLAAARAEDDAPWTGLVDEGEAALADGAHEAQHDDDAAARDALSQAPAWPRRPASRIPGAQVRARAGTPLGEDVVPAATTVFPYIVGRSFIQTLAREHALPDVVRLTLEFVPQSSREILHPDAYVKGEVPVVLELPALSRLRNTRLAQTNTLGEFGTHMALGAGPMAAHVASGWRGDTVLVLARGKAPVAAVWASAWRSPEAAERFGRAAVTVTLRRGGRQDRSGGLWLDGERFWVLRRGHVVAVVSDVAPALRRELFAALSADLARLSP